MRGPCGPRGVPRSTQHASRDGQRASGVCFVRSARSMASACADANRGVRRRASPRGSMTSSLACRACRSILTRLPGAPSPRSASPAREHVADTSRARPAGPRAECSALDGRRAARLGRPRARASPRATRRVGAAPRLGWVVDAAAGRLGESLHPSPSPSRPDPDRRTRLPRRLSRGARRARPRVAPRPRPRTTTKPQRRGLRAGRRRARVFVVGKLLKVRERARAHESSLGAVGRESTSEAIARLCARASTIFTSSSSAGWTEHQGRGRGATSGSAWILPVGTGGWVAARAPRGRRQGQLDATPAAARAFEASSWKHRRGVGL